jgi:hypothetical protein
MEISKDGSKIEEKLVTRKRGSCDQFLAKIKFSNPSSVEDGRIQKIFLIDFDIWNIKIRVRTRKLDQFQVWTPN